MSIPLIFLDVLIVIALGLSMFYSAQKGFVLTLCSLAAVIVALIGANFLANSITPQISEALEPTLEISIQQHLEDYAEQNGLTLGDLTAGSALNSLKEKGGVYRWAAEKLEIAIQSELAETATHIAVQAAASAAEVITHSVILLVGFVLVLLAWTLLAHALDLVAHLPVLSMLNHFGGAVLGLLKGCLMVWVVLWIVCDLIGWMTPDMVSQTNLIYFMQQHSPFRFLMTV